MAFLTESLFVLTGNPTGMTADELSWETTSRETVYSCPGFDIINEDVILPDGVETEYDHLQDVPAVVIIPHTPDGRIVVIEEWRQSVKRVIRGFPAGSIEPDDTDILAAAARELEEETGYVPHSLTYLDSFEPANGVMDVSFHYVLAEGCRPEGVQNLDHNESIRVDTTTMARLTTRLHKGELTDGRTAMGVLLARFHRDTVRERND
jgi:ADP-ribose pyrophosphatase